MRYLFTGLLSIFFISTFAQQKCGQHILENQYRIANPAVEAEFEAYDQWISQAQYKTDRADKIIVPVVFHVIHQNGPENIADEQIFDAIRIMNRDFNALNDELEDIDPAFENLIGNGEIEFRLARIDPDGNPTTGIDRIESGETFVGDDGSKLNPWPRANYYNIWVTDVIAVGGAAAYAYRPINVNSSNQASVDGVISNHRYVGSIGTSSLSGSKTLTHETGHYLGLPHTWGPTNEPGLATNCSVDDQINDTPNTVGVGNSSCNPSQISCGSQDNVQNFMDYASCESMFTIGQINVMRATLGSSVAQRNQMVTTSNLAATGLSDLSEAKYYAEKQTLCRGEVLALFDESTYDADSWSWKLSSLYAEYTSTDQHPEITMDQAGIYDIELTVKQGSQTEVLVQEGAIAVLEYLGAPLPYAEDFEIVDYGWFTDEHEVISNNLWSYDTQHGSGDNTSYKFYNIGAETQSVNDLVFSSLDARSVSSVSISFDAAYRQFQNDDDDKLELFFSNDCGEVMRPTWSKSGSQLSAGAALTTSIFSPTSSDFETFTVNNIPSEWVSGSTILMFRFTSGGGNNLFIDNINVSGNFGITPYLSYPGHEAEGVPVDVKLDWLHLANASSYQLQIDTDPSFGTSALVTETKTAIEDLSTNDDTEHNISGLEAGQTYYWRVRAIAGGSNTAYSDTWSFTVTDNGVGISESDLNQISIYPNPVTDRLFLDGDLSVDTQVWVTSVTGQRVINLKMSKENATSIDVSNLKSGVYFISFLSNDELVTKQFVVSN